MTEIPWVVTPRLSIVYCTVELFGGLRCGQKIIRVRNMHRLKTFKGDDIGEGGNAGT